MIVRDMKSGLEAGVSLGLHEKCRMAGCFTSQYWKVLEMLRFMLRSMGERGGSGAVSRLSNDGLGDAGRPNRQTGKRANGQTGREILENFFK